MKFLCPTENFAVEPQRGFMSTELSIDGLRHMMVAIDLMFVVRVGYVECPTCHERKYGLSNIRCDLK